MNHRKAALTALGQINEFFRQAVGRESTREASLRKTFLDQWLDRIEART